MKVAENATAREIERDRWEPLIANACYGWLGERAREEAGVRDRAYIVSHRCTWYSYNLAQMIPGADIVEHGDLSVTVNGVRVPPGGAVTWTERRDVDAPSWEHAREAWNVQTWTPEQVLEIVSRQEDGERDQWENNAQRIKAALAVEGADGDVRVTREGVSLNGVSAKPGEALVWETWGDQVSHVHVADNDVVRLSMEEYERTDYPGVSLVRLYDNTEK